MSSSGISLAVTDLEVRRGSTRLIEGLSFSLRAGQRALVIGSNGTGKTSLLRILAGIAPVTAGDVVLDGVRALHWGPEQRRLIAYRGHLDGLKADLSARENIMFYRELRGYSISDYEVDARLRIDHVLDRPLRQLSAGQRRRVGFAALRAQQASVWLLDEPATNLDADGRGLVATWLDEHTANGGIAVIATHQPELLAVPGSIMVEL